MRTAPILDSGSSVLVVGFGLHGRGVAAALSSRGYSIAVVDDQPSAEAAAAAREMGFDLIASPSAVELAAAVQDASHVVPTPGLPESHPLFGLSRAGEVIVCSEFDLAHQWDDRPVVAITGTNGKTTVTTMVTQMLSASGISAVMAGNMEVPLVTAIDCEADVFVVEASSFRLGHSRSFAPHVATWLNLTPDHLDIHASMDGYEAAKARIWAEQASDDIAIANAEDDVVLRNLPQRPRRQTFGAGARDAFVREGAVWVNQECIVEVSELVRTLPHDISNALAAALTATVAGAGSEAVAATLATFEGLPHRVQFVGEDQGVRWINDSKATTPQAVVAGMAGFESVVLIAGGRNKGVDLAPLRGLAARLRGVVAIGEASDEVSEVFDGIAELATASEMSEAVSLAGAMARSGDVVALSPACTSFDWYQSYAARGEDFMKAVRARINKESQK